MRDKNRQAHRPTKTHGSQWPGLQSQMLRREMELCTGPGMVADKRQRGVVYGDSAFCEIHLPLEPRWGDRDVLASAGLEESLCCLRDSRTCGRTFHRNIRNQVTNITRALA